MARQQKKLPARRRSAVDESLLIRSAESLGRVIGSLQRQLDAARRLVGQAADDQQTNGHAPVRKRSRVITERRHGVPVNSAKAAAKATSAGRNKTTKGRTSSATSARGSKKR